MWELGLAEELELPLKDRKSVCDLTGTEALPTLI